jgi:hypothetical protein
VTEAPRLPVGAVLATGVVVGGHVRSTQLLGAGTLVEGRTVMAGPVALTDGATGNGDAQTVAAADDSGLRLGTFGGARRGGAAGPGAVGRGGAARERGGGEGAGVTSG